MIDCKINQQEVIASLLIYGATPENQMVIGRLSADMFDGIEKRMFAACGEALEKEGSCDLMAVYDLVSAADRAWAMDFSKNYAVSSSVKFHAKKIRQCKILNEAIERCRQVVETIPVQKDISAASKMLESLLMDLTVETDDRMPVLLKDIAPNWANELEQRLENPTITGLLTGVDCIDDSIGRIAMTDMIVVAGAPGWGKTEFGLMMVSNLALENKRPALVFSIEMSRMEIYQRFIAEKASVSGRSLQEPAQLNQEDWDKIGAAAGSINESLIYVDDSPEISLSEIVAKAKLWKAKHPDIGIIMVDYIQNIELPAADSHRLSMAKATKKFKALAKEIHCPVMLVSQINRNHANRANKEPNNQDLAESASIERDANIILFPYREDEAGVHNSPNKGLAKIIVGKHRSAEKRDFVMAWENGHFIPTNRAWGGFDSEDQLEQDFI